MLGSFIVQGAIVKGLDDSQGLYGLTLKRIEILDNEIWILGDISQNWTNLSCLSDDIPWIAGRALTARSYVNLGKEWLRVCGENHSSCKSVTEFEMPTRVIDVGIERSQEPRLIETHGCLGQWVTLSYPWGGAKPITTRSTYKDNLKELSFASLPRMFQDTLQVVRDLGFRYLWIDSICIIQGDLDDWARECDRMAKVYEQSVLTIAACAASSPDDPLIPLPHSNDIIRCSFKKGSIEFTASLDDMIEYGDVSMPTERNSLIKTRGWCFQERLLAPRVLFLGSKQPYWECCTCQFFEFLRVPFPLTGKKPEVAKIGVTHTISKSMFAVDAAMNQAYWFDMVESYSRCNLTNNEDKLPALSGIAQAITDKVADAYLAGIWMKGLTAGLCWLRTPSRHESDQDERYRAPSWSWASISHPVQFCIPHFAPYEDLDPAFELINVTTTPATKDRFGRVSDATMTIRGHVKTFVLTPSARNPDLDSYDEQTIRLTVDYWPDRAQTNGSKARRIPCLLIAHSYAFAGLALEEVEGRPDTYRRLGFVYNSSFLYELRAANWWRERQLKKWLKKDRQLLHLI